MQFCEKNRQKNHLWRPRTYFKQPRLLFKKCGSNRLHLWCVCTVLLLCMLCILLISKYLPVQCCYWDRVFINFISKVQTIWYKNVWNHEFFASQLWQSRSQKTILHTIKTLLMNWLYFFLSSIYHPCALCVIFTILVSFSRDNALLFASKAKINVLWNFPELTEWIRSEQNLKK